MAVVADGGRLKVVTIVVGERASGVVRFAIVHSVGVVAVSVPTVPAVINSSLHTSIFYSFISPVCGRITSTKKQSYCTCQLLRLIVVNDVLLVDECQFLNLSIV